MRRLLAIGMLAAAVMSCRTSPSVEDYPPAVEPSGILGYITPMAGETSLRVELLAVDDSSYIVLAQDRVVIAPFRALSTARFHPIGTTTSNGRTPSADHRAQLRYASRFPYGISSAVMSALLAKSGQVRPDELAAVLQHVSPTSAVTDSAVTHFVARAREGSARFRDQQAAIDAGFSRVGVDFPAMGEHWVNLHRVAVDSFDAAMPSVLIYVRIRGVSALAGVAYTAVIKPGDPLPGLAAARSFWHEHNGTVVDESLAVVAASTTMNPTDPHLAILHAWVWADNPDGVFTTDNWSLPFLRMGLAAPEHPMPELAGALSLAAGTADYYLLAARHAASLSDAEARDAEAVLHSEGARMAQEVAVKGATGVIGPDDERALAMRWIELWDAVAAVAPQHSAALRALAHDDGSHSHHRGP